MIFDPRVIVKGSNSYNMPLIVTTPTAGTKVIATQGNTTVSSIANLDGQATLLLPTSGEYQVHTELDGVTSDYKTVIAPNSLSVTFSPVRLPTAYTELEYIANASSISSQKAYQLYGTLPSNLRIEFDMSVVQLPSGTFKSTPLFGSYVKDSYYSGLRLGVYNNQLYITSIYQANNDTNGDILFAFSSPQRLKGVWDYMNSKITLNGTAYTAPKGTPYSNLYRSFYLFSYGTTPTLSTNTANIGLTRLYSFKTYNADTLVSDRVPARRKSDNVVGLYDMVSGNFLVSSYASAAFVGGPEV